MQLIIPEPYRADMGSRVTGEDFEKAAREAKEARENQRPHCVREGDNSGYRPFKWSR